MTETVTDGSASIPLCPGDVKENKKVTLYVTDGSASVPLAGQVRFRREVIADSCCNEGVGVGKGNAKVGGKGVLQRWDMYVTDGSASVPLE